MKHLAKTLEIRTSPHIGSGTGTDSIMFNVVLALAPTTLAAVYWFGLAALVTILVAIGTCVGTATVLNMVNSRFQNYFEIPF